jgi:hypothetical protein
MFLPFVSQRPAVQTKLLLIALERLNVGLLTAQGNFLLKKSRGKKTHFM